MSTINHVVRVDHYIHVVPPPTNSNTLTHNSITNPMPQYDHNGNVALRTNKPAQNFWREEVPQSKGLPRHYSNPIPPNPFIGPILPFEI